MARHKSAARDPSFARRLQAYRLRAGYTQTKLAEHLQVRPETVCNWETGRTEPRATELAAMARLFGTPADVLLGLVGA